MDENEKFLNKTKVYETKNYLGTADKVLERADYVDNIYNVLKHENIYDRDKMGGTFEVTDSEHKTLDPSLKNRRNCETQNMDSTDRNEPGDNGARASPSWFISIERNQEAIDEAHALCSDTSRMSQTSTDVCDETSTEESDTHKEGIEVLLAAYRKERKIYYMKEDKFINSHVTHAENMESSDDLKKMQSMYDKLMEQYISLQAYNMKLKEFAVMSIAHMRNCDEDKNNAEKHLLIGEKEITKMYIRSQNGAKKEKGERNDLEEGSMPEDEFQCVTNVTISEESKQRETFPNELESLEAKNSVKEEVCPGYPQRPKRYDGISGMKDDTKQDRENTEWPKLKKRYSEVGKEMDDASKLKRLVHGDDGMEPIQVHDNMNDPVADIGKQPENERRNEESKNGDDDSLATKRNSSTSVCNSLATKRNSTTSVCSYSDDYESTDDSSESEIFRSASQISAVVDKTLLSKSPSEPSNDEVFIPKPPSEPLHDKMFKPKLPSEPLCDKEFVPKRQSGPIHGEVFLPKPPSEPRNKTRYKRPSKLLSVLQTTLLSEQSWPALPSMKPNKYHQSSRHRKTQPKQSIRPVSNIRRPAIADIQKQSPEIVVSDNNHREQSMMNLCDVKPVSMIQKSQMSLIKNSQDTVPVRPSTVPTELCCKSPRPKSSCNMQTTLYISKDTGLPKPTTANELPVMNDLSRHGTTNVRPRLSRPKMAKIFPAVHNDMATHNGNEGEMKTRKRRTKKMSDELPKLKFGHEAVKQKQMKRKEKASREEILNIHSKNDTTSASNVPQKHQMVSRIPQRVTKNNLLTPSFEPGFHKLLPKIVVTLIHRSRRPRHDAIGRKNGTMSLIPARKKTPYNSKSYGGSEDL